MKTDCRQYATYHTIELVTSYFYRNCRNKVESAAGGVAHDGRRLEGKVGDEQGMMAARRVARTRGGSSPRRS